VYGTSLPRPAFLRASPTDLPVTRETLESIEKGEEALFAMGFRQFRVRHHGELVRIEIAREELPRMLSLSLFAEVSAALKRLGYKYVTLDLEGYRSGSMNALLPASEIARSGPIRTVSCREDCLSRLFLRNQRRYVPWRAGRCGRSSGCSSGRGRLA
jgi:hypothetical protein